MEQISSPFYFCQGKKIMTMYQVKALFSITMMQIKKEFLFMKGDGIFNVSISKLAPSVSQK